MKQVLAITLLIFFKLAAIAQPLSGTLIKAMQCNNSDCFESIIMGKEFAGIDIVTPSMGNMYYLWPMYIDSVEHWIKTDFHMFRRGNIWLHYNTFSKTENDSLFNDFITNHGFKLEPEPMVSRSSTKSDKYISALYPGILIETYIVELDTVVEEPPMYILSMSVEKKE